MYPFKTYISLTRDASVLAELTSSSLRSPQIEEESPFFEMTPQSLLSSQFEIVVVMEGVTEETGNTVQARHFIHTAFQEESDEMYPVQFPQNAITEIG